MLYTEVVWGYSLIKPLTTKAQVERATRLMDRIEWTRKSPGDRFTCAPLRKLRVITYYG